MALVFKYKIGEVAKDFGLPNKDIMTIVGNYFEAPKNQAQALQPEQLDVVFEVLTQQNQLGSLQEVFAPPAPPAPPEEKKEEEKSAEKASAEKAASEKSTEKAAAEKPAEKTAAERTAEKTATEKTPERSSDRSGTAKNGDRSANRSSDSKKQEERKAGENRANSGDRSGKDSRNGNNSGSRNGKSVQTRPQNASASAQQNSQQSAQPAVQQNSQQAAKPQENKPFTPRKVAEKRVVDTRGGSNVNIDKYNEKYDDLGAGKAAKPGMNRNSKEKIQSKSKQRTQTQAASAKHRQEERDKMTKLQLEIAKKAQLKVEIPDEISVGELASRMKKTGAEVCRCLMKLGTFASVSDVIDYDTAALVAMELGCKVEKEVIVTVEERLIDDSADKTEDLKDRAPVVVVMGHVDHGKTSLLDRIRNAHVASGEAGGITQHIGAYTTEINGKPITFLDTPGHEAFTTMRARGAMVTDIAILVVAADDGIMPQTVESINHAKAAGIPVVVAINKMDTVGANPERIKQQLTEYDLVAEEWGGETMVCPISAKTGMGIDNLLENLVVLAEIQELKANPNRAAKGTVIEARLDKGRGPIMTVLVQNGTLRQGDIIIAGTCVGRVRTMTDDRGCHVSTAGPSTPVEISGLSEVPSAGDVFNAVADERMARELAEERRVAMNAPASGTGRKVSLEDLFSQIQAGEMKSLNIIVKADVQGSAEAVKSSLEKMTNDEVCVKVIHSGVGAINESDVMLASTSGAIVVGFNVRPDNAARESAARSDVDIRLYRVIYDCINEIESAMKGMLDPKFKEVIIGHAEVRETYKVSKIGTVCGCYCSDGKIQRGCQVRVLRDNIVVHEGELASLRRFKDDVKEVASGYECGMQVEKFNDIKIGDVIECFVMEQINQ